MAHRLALIQTQAARVRGDVEDSGHLWCDTVDSLTLEDALRSFKTSGTTHQPTRHHTPKDMHPETNYVLSSAVIVYTIQFTMQDQAIF